MWTSRINSISRLLNTNRTNSLKYKVIPSAIYHTDHGVYGAPKRTEKAMKKKLKVYEDYKVSSLVWAYRRHGYSIGNTDLLNLKKVEKGHPELEAANYGILPEEEHNASDVLHCSLEQSRLKTPQLVSLLHEVYCGTITAEFHHIQNLEEREWFAENFEKSHDEKLTDEQKIYYAKLMLQSQTFENFLGAKFSTLKRYGGEGAESAIVFYDLLFRLAAQEGISDVVMSLSHRGKLNLLSLLLKYPLPTMFQKMKGLSEFPAGTNATGDALLHFASAVDLTYDNKDVHVTMVRTPSHLEIANAVATGKARARLQTLKTSFYHPDHPADQPLPQPVLCFHVHGDAAFSGQGVTAETFQLANLNHYAVGGTIHMITNNQIGYTTEGDRGRSSINCSDLGKMIDCPVIRINADHPESIVRATKLALKYRQSFQKDIIVDYICYRKMGHNEIDEPSFTQPLMYNTIRARPSIPDAYAHKLVEEGVSSMDELKEASVQWNAHLSEQFKLIDTHTPKAEHLEKQWSGIVQATQQISTWDTGVDIDLLKSVGAQSVTLPTDFTIHPTLARTHRDRRLERLAQGSRLDWATAEALAIGSLLMQGMHVRISGQDVGRGTFSQRHAMFTDQVTDEAVVPLNHFFSTQPAFCEVANSTLSEEAVMAFEFGFSIENPSSLVIWEAQFGDFFNGAQIVIDTLISSCETKWLVHSGLVLLLPHGLDGAGAEHSSCRFERFLQLTDSKECGVDGDDVNFQVSYPTTPAQIFHLLRRQMVRNFRKPLVIVGPKGLLRLAQATSELAEMAPGTHFKPVITDDDVVSEKVKKVVFLTGKHYYTLLSERQERNKHDTALIRLESLCPFPAGELQEEVKKFKNAKEWVWGQEEHRNQGAWTFVAPRFANLVGVNLEYRGRVEGATPGAGISADHKREVQEVNDATFK